MRVKSSGVAVPGLNSSAVKSLRFPAASHEVVDGFSRLADPVNERILRSANESKLLAQVRDTLLPKLISGEIRIPDAERIVSEVA